MDFDDRLRNHLHDQSAEMPIAAEGTGAVRARSRRRKQRRAGGAMMAVLAVAVLAGGWMVGRAGDTPANLATEGDTEEGSTAGQTSTTVADGSGAAPGEIENVLPELGAALTLSPIETEGAPGGYNVFQNGRTDGVYYVVSTAPGTTWDDEFDGELHRNNTFYTFDGSRWTQSSVDDRFVSNFDSSNAAVLYAISTGSPTERSFEVGTSTNAGTDWSWTEIDLTAIFGADSSTWPSYAVRSTSRGSERLVVVRTSNNIDWDEAVQLAIANGADIEDSVDEVLSVDQTGIGWFEATQPLDECSAAHQDVLNDLWAEEPEGPEFDFERELTQAEQNDLDAWFAEQEIRAENIQTEALGAVARIPGCETFVKCSNELDEQIEQNRIDTEAALSEYDIDQSDYESLTEEQLVILDAIYTAESEQINAWADESGCGETLHFWGPEVDGGFENYRTWAELGVTAPESWNGVTNAFLVVDNEVTNLGEVFNDQPGFLIEVDSDASGWTVTFDSSTFSNQQTAPAFATWSSTDALTWTSSTSDQFIWNEKAQLTDGTTFWVQWENDQNQLIRTSPNGTTNAISLADLAPDVDTSGFTLLNVKAGEYGVVVWAVNWDELDSGGNYRSLIAYSPDGIGWGVTEVPEEEVVDVIVGDDGIMIFLNDPNRPVDSPQPIVFGTAN